MPSLEDYLNGVPLTPELARLRDGIPDTPEPEPMGIPAWEPDNIERPLNDSEREDLAKLLTDPGWRVLQRLRKKYLRQMEREAILLSQTNPLANEHSIAIGWANLAAFKLQMRLDTGVIEEEVQQLKKSKGIK